MEQAINDHTDILNFLIEKKGYKTYLEIGVGDPRVNFSLVQCEEKYGVDPYYDYDDVPRLNDELAQEIDMLVKYRMTSDEFFSRLDDDTKFDLIFIDGLHVEEQCDRDIQNALSHLSENGTIIVHDTNPYAKEHAEERPVYKKGFTWNGNVYKSIDKLRKMNIWHLTYGGDYGVTAIRWHDGFVKNDDVPKSKLTYEEFDSNRAYCLNMVSLEDFLKRLQ